jgi:hypothetical protein
MDIRGDYWGRSTPVVWLHTPKDPMSVPLTHLHPSTGTAYMPRGEDGRVGYFGIPDPRTYYLAEPFVSRPDLLDPIQYDSPYWSFATEHGMSGHSEYFWAYKYNPTNPAHWDNPSVDHKMRAGSIWDAARVYRAGDIVAMDGGSSWSVFRCLRDGNVSRKPRTVTIPLGQTGQIANANQTSDHPDWWQWIGWYHWPAANAAGLPTTPRHINSGSTYVTTHGAPSGLVNWPGWGLGQSGGCWSGRGVEAGRQVGADQWSSGEAQSDNIGPAVRVNAETKDCYHVATQYAPYGEDRNENPDYDGDLIQMPAGARMGTTRLFRMRNGVGTLLAEWTDKSLWRFGGPWCLKLAVQTVNGKPVISVWWRVWGYDPHEDDINWDPWHFFGSYTDTSPEAILVGQPGFATGVALTETFGSGGPIGRDTTDDPWVVAEGFFWYGWGEIDPDSPKAPKGSYVVAAENDRAPASVAAGGDAAYAAKTLAIDSLTAPDASNRVTISGRRGPGSTVTVSPTLGAPGPVTYPTDTTWQCVVDLGG